MDEVFGGENFVGMITYKTKNMPFGGKFLEQMFDYVLWYAKDKSIVKYRKLYTYTKAEGDAHYNYVEYPNGKVESLTSLQINNHKLIPPNAEVFRFVAMFSSGVNKSGFFDIEVEGDIYKYPPNKGWKTTKDSIQRLINVNRVVPWKKGETLGYRIKLSDYPITPIDTVWNDTALLSSKTYVVQTATLAIQRCLLMTTDPGDLVLDPTCGSGTTAYVAEQWGRRWITIDTSRVALALARTRLMSAKYPYYLLADSKDGIQKLAELQGKLPQETKPKGNIKHGFVYKTVPHITLKAIANNQEIDVIHEKYQTLLETLRQQLNTVLKQNWQEWEIPRESAKDWDKTTKDLLAKWWELRQQRQQAIDNSIAKSADSETLYDQPYEDNKRVRVTGPFTVESLSPHRILPTDDTPEHESQSKQERDFENMILDNLRKAGVQNTVKQERIEFNRLEPYVGKWIQAEGEYTDKNGKDIRVAVFVGPEHNTVGALHIKEAAKEAVQGIGFDLLLICGLAFDSSVSEEAKKYGNLKILPVKMNPDLTIGDELLKKTGSGNLFMVFGEPDIKLTEDDGKIQVELLGVDIYDPTTGVIRSDSTDGVACWFIDTNYNGESFFVRHAYFTGADKPYEKLQRTLRAEVNEEAWNTLYSTKSRYFNKPQTGQIAVKVINHYGDEVIKVLKSDDEW
jgi:adenine-specific DNA-methyltransferase